MPRLPARLPKSRRQLLRSRKSYQPRVESLERRDLMAGIELSVLSSYSTGAVTLGVSEIAAYDPVSQKVFSTNASQNSLGVLDISNPASPVALPPINLAAYGAGPNSVAVKNGIVAVAVEASPKTSPGKVLFFDTAGNFLHQVTVGALPDMLTFSPDGTKILVANEAEPSGYGVGHTDPEGSVSIIDISGGVLAASVQTAGFTSFNGQEAALRAAGVRIYGPGATAAQDFEPEYITLSPDGATAYVALQENNALAIIDGATATVTSIEPLGYKNHNLADNKLDASDQDGAGSAGLINIRNWPVFGIYSPDAISTFTVGGETYLILANEGDTRDWPGYNEESRVSAGAVPLDAASFAAQGFPDVSNGPAGLKNADNLGRLTVTTSLGDTDGDGDFDQLYVPGGRSFSIRRLDGTLVYDSGDDLEQITAAAYPLNFNASHDNNTFDNRSDNKGPEPEAVTTGVIGGRTYAFIGLERIGGVMVYDVTDPTAPTLVQYLNNRNFTAPVTSVAAGDLGVEDLKFVSAADSPSGTPLLIAANEISGTITLFAINVTPEITSLVVPPSGSVASGEALVLSGTFTDDTLPATHTVLVDWGDGSSSPAVVDEVARAFTASHTYATGGVFTVGATLSDGKFSDSAETTAAVSGLRVVGGVLEIVGTDSHDLLQVKRQSSTTFKIQSDFLTPRNQTIPAAGITELSVVVYAGNDIVSIDASLLVPAVIDGGAGHDLLTAGGGQSTLLGGTGNDVLTALWASAVLAGGDGNDLLLGGRGRDVLIGGLGNDLLLADGNEDILIGGTTAYDRDVASLAAIRAAWNAPAPFATRQAALQTGDIKLVQGETVIDDEATDLLFGGAATDWLLAEDDDLAIS